MPRGLHRELFSVVKVSKALNMLKVCKIKFVLFLKALGERKGELKKLSTKREKGISHIKKSFSLIDNP